MTDLNTLIDDISKLTNADTPSLADLRVKMIELDEYVHSSAFEALGYNDRTRFQTAYKDLRDCIRKLENPSAASSTAAPSFVTSLGGSSSAPAETSAAAPAPEAPARSPYAEQNMEEAEQFFYSGRYAEAIKHYDQVLQFEPRWERARQHRSESENYLRTGYIPSVALPAEAASSFGKAQSAARLGRYADAMSLLVKAQLALRDMGIPRWQDGQEFEQKLQQYIDAESVYSEGLQLFSKGMIDDGIERIDSAAQATGLPKYGDRVQEMRKAKTAMQTIAETLNTPFTDPGQVIEVKSDLDGLYLQFGDNPAFRKLRERLTEIIPTVVEPLKDQVRTLKSQADRAQTIDAALAKARQAKSTLDQARSLGYVDDGLNQLGADVEKLFRDLQRYEDELQQANTVFNTNRSWPRAAAQISQDVRARYPNDPRVIEFNRALSPYNNTRTAIRVGIILAGIILIGALVWFGFNRMQTYFISLTPTATSTPTLTPTNTPLPPTSTPTPRPSATPSLTPTPPSGLVARNVFIRLGCYENFRAIGEVPADATVRFLPAPRQFDNLGRECLQVEYISPDGNHFSGFILIADLK
jgi:tetratricopeptide (TPR) repeat protein